MSTLEMTDRPRIPQHPAIPSAEFRQVLGRFATGVTVMTTRCPQGRVAGVTVSSFNTLSLDPPLVLWSLALNAPSLDVFRAAGRFAVNILAEDQAQLALQFARGAEDKFRGATVSEGLGGVPLIDGAVAHLECVIERRDPGGDHELYIGRTVRTHSSERHPLIYAKGRFGQFTTLS